MRETSLSLLERLQTRPEAADWQERVGIYTPLIRGWLRRAPELDAEAEDLTQDVLRILVEKLPLARTQPVTPGNPGPDRRRRSFPDLTAPSSDSWRWCSTD